MADLLKEIASPHSLPTALARNDNLLIIKNAIIKSKLKNHA
jgi:hypothetical protein